MSADRGSAVVEFAIVVPLVVAVLAAGVEITVLARTQLELVNAAREGAREAATAPDPARAVAASQAALGPEAAGRLRVAVTRPHVVGERATVSLRLPHRLGGPLFGGWTVELRASATMRVER